MVGIANDEEPFGPEDAEALLDEIERLQAEVRRLETRVTVLNKLAFRDALVDLPNRRGFLANLEHLIARVKRYGEPAAMLFIDVDGLKGVNDRFGHKAGDAALSKVSQLIVESVRSSDRVGRLGGDEFGVLLERADELTAWHMALRIVETIAAEKFCVDGTYARLSVAVGVSAVQPDDTPERVMDRADKSMYQLKRSEA